MALLSVFIPHSHASGAAYSRWERYGWHEVASESYEIERAGITIDVTFIAEREGGGTSRAAFEEVAERTYEFLASQITMGPGTPRGRCYDWRLVIYDVSEPVINSRSVLYWFSWKNTYQRLYGAYDSLSTDTPDTAAIVIRSDLPNPLRRQVLAHELTHYWYDMCVSDGMGESYAERAEELFR